MTINHQDLSFESGGKQWKDVYIVGGVCASLVLFGIVLDITFGSISGGNLTELPQTAIDRFGQFRENAILGLYNLDLLNMIIQIFMIPVYVALYGALRKTNPALSLLALILFLVGTSVFITTNSALPMLELSNKYATTTSDSQRTLLAAAGEAMLARGAHGSLGALIGFLLPILAGLIMSIVMFSGKIFSKTSGWLGIAGNILMIIYVVLVTFTPGTKTMATLISMPGGLLLFAWMILFTVKLMRLGMNFPSGQN